MIIIPIVLYTLPILLIRLISFKLIQNTAPSTEPDATPSVNHDHQIKFNTPIQIGLSLLDSAIIFGIAALMSNMDFVPRLQIGLIIVIPLYGIISKMLYPKMTTVQHIQMTLIYGVVLLIMNLSFAFISWDALNF